MVDLGDIGLIWMVPSNESANKLNSIQNRVEAMSKGQQRLSLAVNLLLKLASEEKRNPLDINLPTFLTNSDTTFFRQ